MADGNSKYRLGSIAVKHGLMTQEQYEKSYFEHFNGMTDISYKDFLIEGNYLSKDQIAFLEQEISGTVASEQQEPAEEPARASAPPPPETDVPAEEGPEDNQDLAASAPPPAPTSASSGSSSPCSRASSMRLCASHAPVEADPVREPFLLDERPREARDVADVRPLERLPQTVPVLRRARHEVDEVRVEFV